MTIPETPPADGHLVIGIGAFQRGDDAVGFQVVDALEARSRPPGMTVRAHAGEMAGLLTLWEGWPRVTVVDAARDPALAPGTLRVFDGRTTAFPRDLFPDSSHLVGLAQALALARALNRLPPCLTVVAVVGSDFTLGTLPQPAVTAAGERLVAALANNHPLEDLSA